MDLDEVHGGYTHVLCPCWAGLSLWVFSSSKLNMTSCDYFGTQNALWCSSMWKVCRRTLVQSTGLGVNSRHKLWCSHWLCAPLATFFNLCASVFPPTKWGSSTISLSRVLVRIAGNDECQVLSTVPDTGTNVTLTKVLLFVIISLFSPKSSWS